MTSHLHHFKWGQSAFNAELLRRPRWLLSALPRACPDVFKKILVVTPKSQALFLKLVTHTFTEKTRKVRANQRARMRLSNAEWDAYVNYSCVFAVVLSEAALLDKPPCANTLMKSFLDMWLGFRTFNHDWSLELSVIGLVGAQILRFCCPTPGCFTGTISKRLMRVSAWKLPDGRFRNSPCGVTWSKNLMPTWSWPTQQPLRQLKTKRLSWRRHHLLPFELRLRHLSKYSIKMQTYSMNLTES